jgi:hypothetical protein
MKTFEINNKGICRKLEDSNIPEGAVRITFGHDVTPQAAFRLRELIKDTLRETPVQSTLPLTDIEKAALYRDWFNNYTTLQHFAHCKGYTRQQASDVIAEGRRIHEASVKPAPRSFTCISVSSNANSFGYRAALFLAEDGTGYECLYSFGDEKPSKGDVVTEDKLPTYCRRELKKATPALAKKVITEAKA